MINFAVAPKEENPLISKIKSMAVTVTTIVLVVYIVILGGIGGFWWVQSNKQISASKELQRLQGEVTKYSKQEVAVRNVYQRSQAIQAFFNARGNLSDTTSKLMIQGMQITGWTYDSASKQTVQVAAKSPTEIKDYVSALGKSFPGIKLESASYTPGTQWSGVISVGGGAAKK